VLLTGLHRRRRELAVLKTLGLVRSQLLRVAAWQATALAAAALVIGLPLGVLAGRWAWAVFAGSAGVSGVADVPAPLVLLAIPATLALANLIAAGPGWNAARGRPASVLRTELSARKTAAGSARRQTARDDHEDARRHHRHRNHPEQVTARRYSPDRRGFL
jgi:predicted lysophospholipase L1 biosynthesis ABC-type transport system permease subunit